MVPEETLERAAVDDVSPRYLRKQKPADSDRRRIRQVGSLVRRFLAVSIVAVLGGAALADTIHFLLCSPRMLLHSDQIQMNGLHVLNGNELAAVFLPDLGRSVLLIPLERRRETLERIPWVKQATIERALPDRLVVQIVERQPVAFLRAGSTMRLIDADGAILDRSPGTNLNLPVVSGFDEQTPLQDRASRVGLFVDFLNGIETARAGTAAEVSEADLSDPEDVQATLAGVPEFAGQGPVEVHFGEGNFAARYRTLIGNFAEWRAKAGNILSVDLRFEGQVLVTPAGPLPVPATPASGPPPAPAPAGARAGALGQPPSPAQPQTAASLPPAEKASDAVLQKTRRGTAKR
jgi:cell division protein FtsQ